MGRRHFFREATFKKYLPLFLRSLFESPTVAEMAVIITQGQAQNAEPEEIEKLLTELEALSDSEVQQYLAEENR